MEPEAPAPWFVPLEAETAAGHRVFGFPAAGAGPAAFGGLARGLRGSGTELWSVNLPGREARFVDPPLTGLAKLTDVLAVDLAGRADRPYSLFGHCAGALFAYLVARRLSGMEVRQPTRLILASYQAPDTPNRFAAELADLDPDEFWQRVVAAGHVPEQIAALPGADLVFAPAMRADYRLLAGYRPTDGPKPAVPVTVLAEPGSRPDQAGWARYTTGPFTIRDLDHGGPLTEAADEICVALRELTAPEAR